MSDSVREILNGIGIRDLGIVVKPERITVCLYETELTFAMLERVAEAFGTRAINIGNEFGYYGSHNDTLEILNPTKGMGP